MAARTPLENRIISILKYDTSRPYFGKCKFSELYHAQRFLRRNEYYDFVGSRDARVYIGKIDGDVICGALFRLMGYNPGRFTENPFLYNDQNNIFKFVTDITLPTDTVTADIITGIRRNLREYLSVNSTPNGQWQDEIPTTDGFVLTVLNDGRTGPTYKKLCLLRDSVQLITKQNCADFNKKRGPYRAKIIDVVKQRHPEIFDTHQATVPAPITAPASTTVPAPTTTPTPSVVHVPTPAPVKQPDADVLQELEIIMEKMDNAQITLDNRANVSPELYEQARSEMSELMSAMYDIYRQYSI